MPFPLPAELSLFSAPRLMALIQSFPFGIVREFCAATAGCVFLFSQSQTSSITRDS